ncbi:MAG: Crp/Fnr family transcriptional regulator [Chitinophagaceae bacterium]|nr:Crp/Fnr family transcriptional regulator [Chitinophagaceae bacterium]
MYTLTRFLSYLQKFCNISEEEFGQHLVPVIHERKFEKKQLLTRAGEVEHYFNFILKGLIRKYYLKGKTEINTQISVEGHIIHSQESFHSRLPSEYFVEAIEPSVVASISYNDLEGLFEQSKKMEHLGRMVITYTMVLKDRWQMQMIKMTPRERFLNFVTKNPELLQRVPQKFLASYLNIKPETFSRFKHLLRNVSKGMVA